MRLTTLSALVSISLVFHATHSIAGGGKVYSAKLLSSSNQSGLTEFSGTLQGGSIHLQWLVQRENNVSRYVVERRSLDSDFTAIREIAGVFNSGHSESYEVYDDEPVKPYGYYRIKTVRNDGEVSYSQEIRVKSKGRFFQDFTMYPNPLPMGHDLHLSFKTDEVREILVIIQDVLGKQYYSKVTLSSEGTNEIAIHSYDHDMSPGLYFVVASSETDFIKQRLIVQ